MQGVIAQITIVHWKEHRFMFRKTSHLLLFSILVASVAGMTSAAGAEEKITLFDGKSLDGWMACEPVEKSRWKVGDVRLDPEDSQRLAYSASGTSPGALVNDATPKPRTKEARTVDIYTRQQFGDCTISLEFMMPAGGNSGVYVMGEYEVQIEDNYGQEKLTYQDMGAVYKVSAARVNACRKPGEWQSLQIEFRAPRFQQDQRTAKARFVKIVHNGQVIQENVEPDDVTPGGLTGKERPAGPLMFQGDHGPVAYRNIQVTVPSSQQPQNVTTR